MQVELLGPNRLVLAMANCPLAAIAQGGIAGLAAWQRARAVAG